MFYVNLKETYPFMTRELYKYVIPFVIFGKNCFSEEILDYSHLIPEL